MNIIPWPKKFEPLTVATALTFRLLDLPGEIRNLIYFFVFVELEGRIISWINRPSIIRRLQRRLTNQSPRQLMSLSLLRASRQVRSEALCQLYAVAQIGLLGD